jgi:beta-lactamase regulating signal transducer with metallopeptidase domain
MNGIARLGWTLIHFVWQGAAITAAYTIVREWMLPRTTGPRGRYALACVALMLMAAAPVISYWIEGTGAAQEATSAAPHALISIPRVTAVPAYAVTRSSRGAAVASTGQALPWIVALWFAGALLCWIRLLGGCLVAARMRCTLVYPAPLEWHGRFAELCARIGVSRPVRLLISSWVRIPIVVGWLRPVVLIPVAVLTGLSAEQMEAVLLHELAHIRRHDYLVNILQSMAEAFLFYHPAVWWISGHIRTERELCCDDSAVSLAGDAASYARTLAQLASLQDARLGAAMAVSGGSLKERIARLLGQPEGSSRALPILGVFTLASVGVAAYGLAQSPAVPHARTPIVQAAPNPPLSSSSAPAPLPAPAVTQAAPITMCILIDNSGSMRTKRAAVKAAALALMKASRPHDQVCIVDFNDEVFSGLPDGEDFTSDIGEMEAALTRIDSRGGKAMRDAIRVSIDRLAQTAHNRRKAIVLVTEGNDSASTATQEQVLREAGNSGVPIYCIGLLGDDEPSRAGTARLALGQLAQASGGLAYYPGDLAEVESISPEIANRLRKP